VTLQKEPSQSTLAIVAFAESLAQKHQRQGGDMIDLFAAFTGVVSTQDEQVARDCLIALDRYVTGDTGA
jgi:hypothetical protein